MLTAGFGTFEDADTGCSKLPKCHASAGDKFKALLQYRIHYVKPQYSGRSRTGKSTPIGVVITPRFSIDVTHRRRNDRHGRLAIGAEGVLRSSLTPLM
jgi:hypothetical protein